MNNKIILFSFRACAVAGLMAGGFGCATVFKGTEQTMTFTSTPDGAEVLVDGASQGNTPVFVKLKKNRYNTIMIKKAGYKTVIRPLEKKYDAIALLNVFWDCSTTDLITGAIYEYEPYSYNFNLSKDDGSETSDGVEKKTN